MRRALWGLLAVLLAITVASVVSRVVCWKRDGRWLVLDLRDDRALRCHTFSTSPGDSAALGLLGWCAMPLIEIEGIVTARPVQADDPALLRLRATVATLPPGHGWTHASLLDASTSVGPADVFLSDERSGRSGTVPLHPDPAVPRL